MKKLISILLTLFALIPVYSLSVIERVNETNKNYVASTSWVASIAYVAGLDNVKIIAPANLKQPPEYEITVDDLVNVINADLFMHAGYEKMVSAITSSAELSNDKIIREVYEVLESRRDSPIDSYTSNIMKDSDKKAEDKILEKIAEECGETLIASKNDENLVYESVDLIFHTLLLLVYKGVEFDEILEEFERRRK